MITVKININDILILEKYNIVFKCYFLISTLLVIKPWIPLVLNISTLIFSAISHGRRHNIFGLWSLDLYDKLKDDLINNKIRKVQDWTEKNKIKNLEFKFKDYDPFFNINTKEDLELARQLIAKIKNE